MTMQQRPAKLLGVSVNDENDTLKENSRRKKVLFNLLGLIFRQDDSEL